MKRWVVRKKFVLTTLVALIGLGVVWTGIGVLSQVRSKHRWEKFQKEHGFWKVEVEGVGGIGEGFVVAVYVEPGQKSEVDEIKDILHASLLEKGWEIKKPLIIPINEYSQTGVLMHSNQIWEKGGLKEYIDEPSKTREDKKESSAL
jgi:hypothetical protein